MAPLLEARRLAKRFPARRGGSATVALDDVDLTVEEGEFVAVVGPSGCGKSTLLSILAGLAGASSGQAMIDGQPIVGPGAERAMMFQAYALLPWKTVWDNVDFGLRFGPAGSALSSSERASRVREVIELVGLRGSERKYARDLSGGMQQRCALARVLAVRPRVLLMDEPFAAVDAQTRRRLQSELLTIWAGAGASVRMTCVLVTHALDEAVFLADRVLVMRGAPGTIIADLQVSLSRPRADDVRATSRFNELVETIWRLLYPDDHR